VDAQESKGDATQTMIEDAASMSDSGVVVIRHRGGRWKVSLLVPVTGQAMSGSSSVSLAAAMGIVILKLLEVAGSLEAEVVLDEKVSKIVEANHGANHGGQPR